MIKIYSVQYNRLDLCEIQIQNFKSKIKCEFDYTIIDNSSNKFNFKEPGDIGAFSYNYLEKYKDTLKIKWCVETLLNLEIEKYDDIFIHMKNASNWKGESQQTMLSKLDMIKKLL